MYQGYDTEALRMSITVQHAVRQMSAIMAAQGVQFNGSFPADSRTGGYEDEEGVWHHYWHAGDEVESAPIEPR